MKKPKHISTKELFEKHNKNKIQKNNLLLKENEKNSLSFYRTFSLNNITIKINNKESIEINKTKKRKAFSPKNQVKIFENNLLKLKNSETLNLMKNIPSLQKKKKILEKEITNLNNNIHKIKKQNRYNSMNKYSLENDNEKIKYILKKEENKKTKQNISEDDNSKNNIKSRISKELKEAKINKNNIIIIKTEIQELTEKIKILNEKKNELIKEKYIISNELNEYKKKNENLKKDINKYENSINNFLNNVEALVKLYDSK